MHYKIKHLYVEGLVYFVLFLRTFLMSLSPARVFFFFLSLVRQEREGERERNAEMEKCAMGEGWMDCCVIGATMSPDQTTEIRMSCQSRALRSAGIGPVRISRRCCLRQISWAWCGEYASKHVKLEGPGSMHVCREETGMARRLTKLFFFFFWRRNWGVRFYLPRGLVIIIVTRVRRRRNRFPFFRKVF